MIPPTAVVTAGGTSEPIDDVRVVTNLSTGRLGAALANALAARGVAVTLLASRALAARPEWIDPRVAVVPFGTVAELQRALHDATSEAPDLLFMAAAVSDYGPTAAEGKLSSHDDELVVRMQRHPKLLPTLRARCGPDTLLCGFKLLSGVSTEQLVAVARKQLAAGDLDLCFANDLRELGPGAHPAWLVEPRGEPVRITGPKASVAARLAEHALSLRGLPRAHEPLEQVVLDPGSHADDQLLDELSDALDRAGRHLRTPHPDGFVARGWALRSDGPLAWLSPPSLRDDLGDAASVCLWHRPTDSVLIGRRVAGAYLDHWAFPGGGHDDDDLDERATAVRELAEETGIVVGTDAVELLRTHLTVGTRHRAWRLVNLVLEVSNRDEPEDSDELQARWVPREEAARLQPMAAGTRRILRRLAASLDL